MKHDIEFIMKSNKSLVENKIKNEIDQPLLKYKHGNNIHNTKYNKPNEPNKFFLTCHKD